MINVPKQSADNVDINFHIYLIVYFVYVFHEVVFLFSIHITVQSFRLGHPHFPSGMNYSPLLNPIYHHSVVMTIRDSESLILI